MFAEQFMRDLAESWWSERVQDEIVLRIPETDGMDTVVRWTVSKSPDVNMVRRLAYSEATNREKVSVWPL